MNWEFFIESQQFHLLGLSDSHGGQNILEAAKLGSAVIFGPFTENFNEITSEMVRTTAATRIDKPAALVDAVYSLLINASTRKLQT